MPVDAWGSYGNVVPEQNNERAQVEQVFGLTGGELEDTAWVPTYPAERPTWSVPEGAIEVLVVPVPFTFTYWYQGVPEYVERDFDALPLSYAPTYRTVCRDEMFGQVPETVTDDEGTWTVVTRYTTSGEAECPLRNDDTGLAYVAGERCSFCEETRGELHGVVYIGDGWAEIVYRLQVPYEHNTMHPGESGAEFTKRYLGESRDD